MMDATTIRWSCVLLFWAFLCCTSHAVASHTSYGTALTSHFTYAPIRGTPWTCLQLSAILGRLYHSEEPPPVAHWQLRLRQPTLGPNLLTAIRNCWDIEPYFRQDPHLVRHYLWVTAMTEGEEAFLTTFLSTFFPLTPKQMPMLHSLFHDTTRLRRADPEQPLFRKIDLLMDTLLRPSQGFARLENTFSPFFLTFLEGNVWKTHFLYEKAFASLSQLLETYYGRQAKPIPPLFPYESRLLKEKFSSLLESSAVLLKQCQWLAGRIGSPKAWNTYQKYAQSTAAPKVITSRGTQDTADEKVLANQWSARLKDIKGIWTQDRPTDAKQAAQHLLSDIWQASLRIRTLKAVKAILGDLHLLLAMLSEALGNHSETFFWFDQAEHICASPTMECFLPYHRVRAYVHIGQNTHADAIPFLERVISTPILEPYDKQEFYFWRWLLARMRGETFDYAFPYLSIYRHYAECLGYPVTPLPKWKKSENPTLDAKWLKSVLSAREIKLLDRAFSLPKTEPFVQYLLGKAANQMIVEQQDRKFGDMPLHHFKGFLHELQKHELYPESIGLVFQQMKRTPLEKLAPELLDYYFPIRYTTAITKAAETFQIPLSLISAIIRRESIFDGSATSPAYAMGAMQILPHTAELLASSNHIPYMHYDDGGTPTLFIPDHNIYLGTLYLKRLFSEYANPIAAIASYNAGESRVRKWMGDTKSLNTFPLLFMERIPYAETRQYVKWVLLYYLYYSQIYEPAHFPKAKQEFCSLVTNGPFGEVKKFAYSSRNP